MSEIRKVNIKEVAELVPPMDREQLREVDYDPQPDSDNYLYLDQKSGQVFVNALPHNEEEMGPAFWLKVLKPEMALEVERHPYFYSPGKVAVQAAVETHYGSWSRAA
jgi:hypothetical protein